MTSNWQRGKRRIAVVAAATLSLTALAGVYFTGSAFAADNKGPGSPPDSEDSPVAVQAHHTPLVPGTPCTITAKSCVDLESQRAWLFKDGKIFRGPVKIASGGNGKETPVGHSLRVYRKDKDFKSTESRMPNGQPAPMPWSVFFQDGGIAFHSGDPNRSSAGCIHLTPADAQAWFNYLQVGDQVQAVKASQEMAARKADAGNNSQPQGDDDNDNHRSKHRHHDSDDDD
jgi:L,D-transpeptidase catalytic domain